MTSGMNNNLSVTEILKKVDMLDVMMWVSSAWGETKPLTKRPWRRKPLDHKVTDKWVGETPEYINNNYNNEEGNKMAELVNTCLDVWTLPKIK